MTKPEVEADSFNRLSGTVADAPPVALLIAVTSIVDPMELREAAQQAMLDPTASGGSGEGVSANLNVAVAYPASSTQNPGEIPAETSSNGTRIQFRNFSPAAGSPTLPLVPTQADYEPVFTLARELGAAVCICTAPDLVALRSGLISRLAEPVLAERAALALPIYPAGKFEPLLNTGILAPLPRALYGRRVRFPLAPDFAIAGSLLAEIEPSVRRAQPAGNLLFWPATEAALRDRTICQVHTGVYHHPADGRDLGSILNATVGPLFAEMENRAADWQSVRGSQPGEISGAPSVLQRDQEPVDVRPMLETFKLGFRNLLEVWGLVLPPVTLLELKRMTRLPAESFRMADDLWARIVYDFALAYRLRNISRSHLLGALSPLYLGWVASYVLETAPMRAHEVEQRMERLARAFEESKPYLISRWRWPDRFNP